MAIKLARLPTNWERQPELVRRYWDTTMTELEKTLNAILAIPVIEEALANLDTAVEAAQTAAENAQIAADAANAAAEQSKAETSLINSYIENFTAPLISSDSLGNITVAAHDRVYGDSVLNPTVSVAGASIASGASPGDIVRVYYIDPSRAGGTVSYLFTIDPTTPQAQTGDTHSVGAVSVPAVGSTDGNFVRPPGFVEP